MFISLTLICETESFTGATWAKEVEDKKRTNKDPIKNGKYFCICKGATFIILKVSQITRNISKSLLKPQNSYINFFNHLFVPADWFSQICAP